MINTTNLFQHIPIETRRTIIQRAVYTQPYFYRVSMPFGLPANSKQTIFSNGVIGINRDFYLTERQANFNEVEADSNALFDIAIYSGYGRSVYRFDSNTQKLQSGFVCQEARIQPVQTNSLFDDKQFEPFPVLIRRGDRVYVELRNTVENPTDDVVEVILKGFNVLDNVYLTPTQTQQINTSLERDVEWQYFKFVIDEGREKSYVIENDNKPRLLLGFGANADIAKAFSMETDITDITRRLKLTDTKIPIEFIAPTVPTCFDTHIYYLPTEYYLEPYAKLQFDVGFNDAIFEFDPIEVAALTRTI